MRRLTGLSRRQWRGLTDEQLATLAHGLDWLELRACARPLRESLRRGLTRYYLPAAKFADGTAVEFAMADECFQQFLDGDEAAALRLLATLARPRRQGRRISVTDWDEVDARQRRFRGLPPEWTLQAVMYWAGVKEFVHATYGEWLFRQPDDENEDTAPTGPNFGWWGILMNIAESGPFGSLEKVHQRNFHEVCTYLVQKEAARREHERKLTHMRATQQNNPG